MIKILLVLPHTENTQRQKRLIRFSAYDFYLVPLFLKRKGISFLDLYGKFFQMQLFYRLVPFITEPLIKNGHNHLFFKIRAAALRRGIPVHMGTDAYTHDMLESLKVFLIIQRHNAAMPNVGWVEAMTMLFQNNPAMASTYFGREVGVLAPGAAADVIVMDYPVFTPFSDENIDGHMLFGMMGKNCRTTIVNGKVLYKDREFVAFDEERINAWTLEQSKKLWGTLNERTY